MHFRKARFIALALSILVSGNTLALGWLPDKYVFSLNGGVDFVNPGQAQTIALGSSVQGAFTSNSLFQVLADAGLSASGQWDLFSLFSVQAGLTGGFNTQSKSSGEVNFISKTGPSATNYSYNLKHGRIMASGKFLVNLPVLSLHPYVSVDFGLAFNSLSDYNQTLVDKNTTPLLPFKDSTSLSMTYAFGLGVEYDLMSFLRIGGGYHFYDFGPANFAKTIDDPAQQALSLSHYFGHQLRFHLSVVL